TIWVAKFGQSLKDSLKKYEDVCKVDVEEPPVIIPRPIRPPNPIIPGPIRPPHPPTDTKCVEGWKRVGAETEVTVEAHKASLFGMDVSLQSKELHELVDLGLKLAKNMKEAKPQTLPHLELGHARAALGAGGGGLNVTTGGAMDMGSFRRNVEEGYVPGPESLAVEGLMKEFDLSLTAKSCAKLLCIQPAYQISGKENKLYVQVGMASNVTKENFKRSPLNLAVVLDISGSMQGTDGTSKSRLEWAKEALVHTINQLEPTDSFSLTVFDTSSEILIPTTLAANKANLLATVAGLKTKGSTNLESGLRDGYELASKAFRQGYENRVLLISDAGLNTGVTDENSILKLVSDFASEDIGLTAIGLGLNFKQELIHNITMSKGGNYVFVNSGEKMFKFFESFDFLVTPVAYNFKASLHLGIYEGAKLVKAYGVPVKEDEPLRDLIDVRTLFFSEEGGAMLLEYDLK
ncbi:MAG: VWA domain-containing protein, partial [Bdellovibrionales bacterium]|nr:VWA domain-containing protein [Bdellovibrionales bacterium]